MQSLTDIKLDPVITFFLPDMGDHFYKGPKQDGSYYDYWKKTLMEYGLGNLEPIKQGYNYVRTNEINNESLRVLIKWFLEHRYDMGIDQINDEIEQSTKKCLEEGDDDIDLCFPPSFEGGVILTNGADIVITPQCCINLHDYKEWTKIKPSTDFKLIWIGHPWIYYKMQGENILLTRLIEKSFSGEWKYYTSKILVDKTIIYDSDFFVKEGKIVEDSDVLFSINYEVFKVALQELERELAHFKNRIENICHQLGLKDAVKIADTLINGNGGLSYNEKGVN